MGVSPSCLTMFKSPVQSQDLGRREDRCEETNWGSVWGLEQWQKSVRKRMRKGIWVHFAHKFKNNYKLLEKSPAEDTMKEQVNIKPTERSHEIILQDPFKMGVTWQNIYKSILRIMWHHCESLKVFSWMQLLLFFIIINIIVVFIYHHDWASENLRGIVSWEKSFTKGCKSEHSGQSRHYHWICSNFECSLIIQSTYVEIGEVYGMCRVNPGCKYCWWSDEAVIRCRTLC